LKGEVTVVFQDDAEFEALESVFLMVQNNLVPYFLEGFSDRGDKAFIKFEDVNTIEEASALKGCVIYLAKTVRPKLKRGQFYDDEVVGFTVEDEGAGVLGLVTEVQASGLSRLLAIDHEGKEVLVPIDGPFIQSVNKSKKLIKVSLPEGFLEM
jgi:16S rRNA processing protein RimM